MSNPPARSAVIETFIEWARRLSDDDRMRLAEARAAIDETFHAGAWKAATEIAAQHDRSDRDAWVRIGPAFVPDCLEGLVQTAADRAAITRWQDVARLVRAAMEDALLALSVADLLRPPDLRELFGPWKAMLDAAGQSTPPAEVRQRS